MTINPMKIYLDLQADLLKNWGKLNQLTWQETKDDILLIRDGHTMLIIPDSCFALDRDLLFQKGVPTTQAAGLLSTEGKAYQAGKLTGTKIREGASTLVILEAPDGAQVMAQQKLMKPFLKKDFTLSIAGPRDLIRVGLVDFEGSLVAAIAPVAENIKD